MHVGRWAQAKVVHGGQWTQAARDVVGRANVRHCHASSLLLKAATRKSQRELIHRHQQVRVC